MRLLIAMVAVATLASFGGQVLHMTIVAHAVCPSHGQVVHGDDHDSRSVVASERAQPVVQQADLAEDHDHCDAPAVSTPLAAAPPCLGDVVELSALPVRAPVAAGKIISRRLRLLMAPKTPPPA